MYCRHCGTYNEDNVNFCSKCGGEFDKSTVLNDNIQISHSGSAVVKRPCLEDGFFFKSVGFFKKLCLFAVGVLFTFAIAAIVFAYFHPEYFSDFISYMSRFLY